MNRGLAGCVLRCALKEVHGFVAEAAAFFDGEGDERVWGAGGTEEGHCVAPLIFLQGFGGLRGDARGDALVVGG